MIGTFCNRIERQIEIRFKALSSIELMNTKQNEVLSDVERMRVALENINLYYQESADKLNGVQLNARSSKEMTQNLLQQMQNQRAEFKLIRSELNTALDIMNAVPYSKQNRFKPETNDDDVFASVPIQKEEIRIERDPSQIIDDLIEKKHIELNELEKNTENQDPEKIQDNAAELLSLIRAQHNEIQRVADDAKQFLKGTMKQIKNKESPQEVAQSSTQESEQNTDPEVS